MSLRLGYTWDPEIDTQITGALAFYPFCTLTSTLFSIIKRQSSLRHPYVATAFAFLTAMALVPIVCFPDRKFGDTAFRILVWSSMSLSALAFLFMVGIASVAKYRFERNGFTASFGNLVRNQKLFAFRPPSLNPRDH